MNDRFKFNAIVSSYYDVDTPEEYKEVEPQFYLKNVDVFNNGEIGIFYDKLLDEVRKQSPNLTEKEIGQIMKHFEDNSNSPECDFVSITPDKILQCTGLKDKNGKLIYEGDIVTGKDHFKRDRKCIVKYSETYCCYFIVGDGWSDEYMFNLNDKEVIGNIYENKELLNDN